jgi:hypothetical protein
LELYIGVTWSTETWGTWANMMRDYKNGIFFSTRSSPKVIFGTGSAVQGSGNGARPSSISVEEWVRYGFACCLQDDGYFAAATSSDYASEQWIDDMDFDLGNAIGAPDYNNNPSAAESGYNAKTQGIHWREYDNGIAIVNPKGNGNKTGVTLPDPGVNNVWKTLADVTVTTFNLDERHGLILKRVAT